MAEPVEAKLRWDNKILSVGEDTPENLLAHPLNFKIHSGIQQDAMRGVLDEIGWIDTVRVNRNSGLMVDGHMRVILAMREAPDQPIPVMYLDLTEEEEIKALAYFDAIGHIYFASDTAQYEEVLRTVQEDDDALKSMINDIVKSEKLFKTTPFDMGDVAPPIPTDTDTGVTNSATSSIPMSSVRTVQLFFNTETQPLFLKFCEALATPLDTNNLSDTVFKAIEYAYEHLAKDAEE